MPDSEAILSAEQHDEMLMQAAWGVDHPEAWVTALRVDREALRDRVAVLTDLNEAERVNFRVQFDRAERLAEQVAVLTEERDAARAHVRRGAEMRLRVEHDLANAFGRAGTAEARVAVLEAGLRRTIPWLEDLVAQSADWSTPAEVEVRSTLHDVRALLGGGVPATKEEQT